MNIWHTKFPDILDSSLIYIEYCNQDVEIIPINCVDQRRYIERWAYLSDIRKLIDFDFSDVSYSTIRDGDDELHIEVRFKDGQKFAAITIDKKLKDSEKLANFIDYLINKKD